jgi:meso-butanediol dehydrogenase / (S,S)-butanediol dehydrogenase / diacetyl reductase
MQGKLAGKVALITGSASGIGRASALKFAGEGAKVVVVDQNVQGGEEVVKQIEAELGESLFVKADITKSLDVMNMVETAIKQYGRLDILFNNAGVALPGTVIETSEETWDRVINTNLKGTFLGSKFAIPHMIEQGGGSIINTASVNGLVAFPGEAAYDASKGGIVLLTKAIALDFGKHKIRCNCICPGITDTPQVRGFADKTQDPAKYFAELSRLNAALDRLLRPEEIANVALFLASDASTAITGSAIVADGGYSAI